MAVGMNSITPEQAQRLHQNGQLEAAETAYRQLRSQFPGRLDIALALTYLLRDQGRRSAAADCIIDWWSQSDQGRLNGLRVVTLLSEMDRIAHAGPVIEHLVRRWPTDAAVLEQAAIAAQGLGQFTKAQEYLQQALERDPQRPGAWLRLVHGRKFSSREDPDLEAVQAQIQRRPEPELEIPLQFALGKIQDDLGHFKAAAQAWRRGNALAIQSAGPIQQPPRSRLTMSVSNWPELDPYDENGEPLFIIGMPRSGTTLLARRLAALEGVRDRGEMNWLGLLLERLPAHPDGATLALIRRHYLAQLVQDDAPARWYIDQNPRNFQYLQAIRHLFPRARIIHLQRRPADVALSIWSQLFAHPDMAWSHRFESIRQEFDRYHHAVSQADASENLINVQYEQLVQETDGVMKQLADELGATTGAGTGDQHSIATASLWQARQPVHTRSIGRAAHYLEHVPALQSFVDLD